MPKGLIKSSFYFPLEIYLDHREPEELMHTFLSFGNAIITRKHLYAGDIEMDDYLVIERKTLPDFFQSLKDGRLFSQVKRLQKLSKPTLLVVEDEKQGIHQHRFRQAAFQSLLFSIQWKFRIPVFFTRNILETVSLCFYCYRSFAGKKQSLGSLCAPRKKRVSSREIQLDMLARIPGIGKRRAMELLKTYGNIKGIIQSPDLESSGIGPKTKKKLLEVLGS
ncbi:MAG: ERCC4 domain-containing protein [Mongoliitalea sp.]